MPRNRVGAALSALLILCLLGGASPVLAAPENDLTLQKSIELALQNNAAYKTARLALEKQGAGLDAAEGRTAPQVKVSANAASDRFQDGLGPEFVVSVAQDTDGFHPLLPSSRYPLPLTSAALAEISERQAKLKLEKAKSDLIYSVTEAYIGVLKARSLVETENEGLKVAEAAREDARLKLSAGVGTNLDVLRADLEVANAQNAVAKARNQVALSEATLFATLGVTPPAGSVNLADPADAKRPAGSVEELAAQAVKLRPEIADAQLGVEKATSALNGARRDKLPTLRLSADYSDKHMDGTAYWDPLDGRAGWTLDLKPSQSATRPNGASANPEWITKLGVTYPLYDAGVQDAVIRQSELDLETAQVALDQAIAAVKSEVLSASLALDEAVQREAAMDKALQQAAEAQRLTEMRVKSGVGTTSELLDANRALGEARVNLLQARYDSRLALARLLKAAGMDKEERS